MDAITHDIIITKILEVGVSECALWLQTFSPNHNLGSLRSSCLRIFDKYKSLNKSKSRPGKLEILTLYRREKFNWPIVKDRSQIKRKSNLLLPEPDEANKSFCVEMIQCLSCVTDDLSKEITDLKLKVSEKENENKRILSNIKEKEISNLEIQTEHRLKADSLLRTKLSLDKKINKKNSDLKRLRVNKSYHENCRKKAQIQIESLKIENESLKTEVDNYKNQIQTLNEQLNESKLENEWLNIKINESDTVILFDKDQNAYKPELQECVYKLLSHNVTTNHVSPVIGIVLELVKKKANKLPSKSTVNNMNIQRLILAQKQLGLDFVKKGNTTLLSDETTKFGLKFEGFHCSDEDGNKWVLGVRQMVAKSGQNTLDALNHILSDIDDVCASSTNEISQKILTNIVSTMSDRAATQMKFNDLLENYRLNILKENIGESWEELTSDEQLACSKLCNFFCGLHVLVHLAESASTAILETEKGFFDGNPPFSNKTFLKATEPGTARLVRTSCKAFACGADEKNGIHGPFQAYIKPFLDSNKMKSLPLQPYRGNRFNILFENAGYVFFLSPKMIEFLENYSNNMLLRGVYHDLCTPEYLAGCKALGLVSVLITVPLWCMIENETIHIMDMGCIYQQFIDYLKECESHINDFMIGELFLPFCKEEDIRNNVVFKELIKTWQHDHLVHVHLSILIPALIKTSKSLFKDHIKDGKWAEVSEELRGKTKGVPKHNKFSETIFGHIDRILREKPNVSSIAVESYVMFVHNKTNDWLSQKNEKERIMIMSDE